MEIGSAVYCDRERALSTRIYKDLKRLTPLVSGFRRMELVRPI